MYSLEAAYVSFQFQEVKDPQLPKAFGSTILFFSQSQNVSTVIRSTCALTGRIEDKEVWDTLMSVLGNLEQMKYITAKVTVAHLSGRLPLLSYWSDPSIILRRQPAGWQVWQVRQRTHLMCLQGSGGIKITQITKTQSSRSSQAVNRLKGIGDVQFPC